MTRARAKLLEQQLNSLLIESNVCVNENFILPKSLHLCILRFINNTSIGGGEEELQHTDFQHQQVREGGEGGMRTRRRWEISVKKKDTCDARTCHETRYTSLRRHII